MTCVVYTVTRVRVFYWLVGHDACVVAEQRLIVADMQQCVYLVREVQIMQVLKTLHTNIILRVREEYGRIEKTLDN